MKNQLFQLQAPETRENKLCTVIRSRTNDALSSEELRCILARASPVFQHSIVVHTLPGAFCDAITPEQDDNIIFGQVKGNILLDEQLPAAVMHGYEIHIYVPLHIYTERKVSHGQREETACCL